MRLTEGNGKVIKLSRIKINFKKKSWHKIRAEISK
jgi:hypothetical protein